MTDETAQLPPEDGLLDLLLVIAENARLQQQQGAPAMLASQLGALKGTGSE